MGTLEASFNRSTKLAYWKKRISASSTGARNVISLMLLLLKLWLILSR